MKIFYLKLHVATSYRSILQTLPFMQVCASFVSNKKKTRNEKLPHWMDHYFLPLTMRNTKEEIFNRVLPFR